MGESQLREHVSSQVAKLIAELRKQRGLSMTALAEKAGLSRAMVSFIEHEHRNPTLDTLLRIAAVLKIDLSELLKKAELRAKKQMH